MAILGFSGTSEGMTQKQRETLRYLFCELELMELHHGDCIGADSQAHEIARKMSCRIVSHPPSNSTKRAFKKADVTRDVLPYLERNRKIAEEGIDGLVAAPLLDEEVLRSGTWSTVRRAIKLSRRVLIIRRDGTFYEKKNI